MILAKILIIIKAFIFVSGHTDGIIAILQCEHFCFHRWHPYIISFVISVNHSSIFE